MYLINGLNSNKSNTQYADLGMGGETMLCTLYQQKGMNVRILVKEKNRYQWVAFLG